MAIFRYAELLHLADSGLTQCNLTALTTHARDSSY